MFKHKRHPYLRAVEGTEAGGSGGTTPPADGGEDNGLQQKPSDAETRLGELEVKLQQAQEETDKWKGFSRQWENRAKGKDADWKLEGDKSADSDNEVTERLANLEQSLTAEREAREKAERENLLLRVAGEEGVDPKDHQFLPNTSDEDVLRKHAKRLAAQQIVETNNFSSQSGATRDSIIERAKKL